jgi:hypothetical protein
MVGRLITKLPWGKGNVERHPICEMISQSLRLLAVIVCIFIVIVPYLNCIDEGVAEGQSILMMSNKIYIT